MAQFVKVTDAAPTDGELAAFKVKGTRITIANSAGSLHAFDDTCTHLQCSLADGTLEGAVVTCPCHGSQFDMTSGAVLRGPARRPERSRLVQLRGEDILVET